MRSKLQNEWRSTAIFILLIIMMTALFFSRALLSVSMIVFVAVAFFHNDIRGHFRRFFDSPLLWGMGLLFFLPLVSGLWSSDSGEWINILRIKLPLLMLPLAFGGPVSLSKKQWEWLVFIFVGFVTAGTIWSMSQYVTDIQSVHEGYLRAKTILTPLQNDHVRFSWMVSSAALLAGWMAWEKRKKSLLVTGVFIFSCLWLIVFLHTLAARTGLGSFYMILLIITGRLFIVKLKWWYSISLLLVIAALPVTAWFTLPTFHNRVRYFLYEFEYVKKTNYLPGSNDAVRWISLRAGWSVLNSFPAAGAGFGDIRSVTKNWYASHYPDMIEEDKIYPSSEWLVYGDGSGWPGVLLFTLVMFIPFLLRSPGKVLWWGLNSTAAFSFIFDIGLEVQFGVFLYAFTVLWWWKWLVPEKV